MFKILNTLTLILWLVLVLIAPGLAVLLILLAVFGYTALMISILFFEIIRDLRQERIQNEKLEDPIDYLKLVKDSLVMMVSVLSAFIFMQFIGRIALLKQDLAERDIENKTMVFNIWENTRTKKKDHVSETRDFSLMLSEMSDEIKNPAIEPDYGEELLPRDLIEYTISFDDGEKYSLKLSSGDRKGILKLVEIFNAKAEERGLEKRFYIVWKRFGKTYIKSNRARIAYFTDKELKKFLDRHEKLEETVK